MKVLSSLEPKSVFRFFEDICAIPHGSGETFAISQYLVDFAEARGLRYRRDELNNVVIFKAASVGYENAPAVMLQGHIDMVCEKESDCALDMSAQGLELFVDGNVIGARGTTLGGDDGIAAAMALAVLDDDTIPHAALECVFTVDEEVGLLGANGFDTSDLKAKYLLNLDSESEGVFTVSCAGASIVTCRFDGKRAAFDGSRLRITVSGLKGGHSGEEIHLGRANADIVMGRVLYALSKTVEMRLVSVTGGSKVNAIARECSAIAVVDDAETAEKIVISLNKELKNEFRTADCDISVTSAKAECGLMPFDMDFTEKVAAYMFTVPNGVQVMSGDVEGLVQTSNNLGRVCTENDSVVFVHMPRSCVDSQKRELVDKMTALCRALGGKAEEASGYGAWQYRADSALRETMMRCYERLFGRKPVASALHAGLECGIFSAKMPELDCISYGPDITDIHTPRERLHIASTLRTWRLTLEVLKELK